MSDLIRHEPRHLPARPTGSVPARRDEEYIYIEEGDALDFRKYLHILLKHKWLILAFLVTGVLLARLETSLTTPLYRSSTTIQIDPPSNILPYEEILAINERLQFDTTQLQILQSRSLARRVVQRLNLAEDPRFNAPVKTGFVDKIPGTYGYVKRAVLSLLPSGGEPLPPAVLKQEHETSRSVGRFLGNLSVQANRGFCPAA